MTAIERRPGSQARVEIGSNGTDVYDADGHLIMHINAPDDYHVEDGFHDELFIAGYVAGFAHGQSGMNPKYKEGDTVR